MDTIGPPRSRNVQIEACWRARALNAEEALKAARTEIRTQRDRLGTLLGRLRDNETFYPAETSQRLAAENTTLKQRVRQITSENRSLEEKLRVAHRCMMMAC